MTGWDREALALRLQAERRALQAEHKAAAAEVTDEMRDNLAAYLAELLSLPGVNVVAEQAELDRRFAGLPMANIEDLLDELAKAERAALPPEPELAAPGAQPGADRLATGQQAPASPTVEAPASAAGVKIPDESNSHVDMIIPGQAPPTPSLYTPGPPHQWPAASGGLWCSGALGHAAPGLLARELAEAERARLEAQRATRREEKPHDGSNN